MISMDSMDLTRIPRLIWVECWVGFCYVSFCKTFKKPRGTQRNQFALFQTSGLVESVDRATMRPCAHFLTDAHCPSSGCGSRCTRLFASYAWPLVCQWHRAVQLCRHPNPKLAPDFGIRSHGHEYYFFQDLKPILHLLRATLSGPSAKHATDNISTWRRATGTHEL